MCGPLTFFGARCTLGFKTTTDSSSTSCLNYNRCIPVTILPGVMNILRDHMSGVCLKTPASPGHRRNLSRGCSVLVIHIAVGTLSRIELRFNSASYVTCLSCRAREAPAHNPSSHAAAANVTLLISCELSQS